LGISLPNEIQHPVGRVHARFLYSIDAIPNGKNIRVLLCDDVQAFRALVRYSLEDEDDIEVVGEAADGNEGVRQAADLQPDVILLDLSMPECDGLEAIPAMRRRSPRTQIVALSGFTAERMSAPVMDAGARAYLEKGVELSEIAATIRQVHAEAA
jgi:DNA-binding NarL/FixJ family response regulator